MSDLRVERHRSNPALWMVMKPDGRLVAGPSTYAVAVGEAVRLVSCAGGGRVVSPLADGGERVVRNVPSAGGPTPDVPQDADPVEQAAQLFDRLTGRSSDAPPSVGDRIGDTAVGDVLPKGVREHRVVRILNKNVSAASAAIALVAVPAGGGLSSVVAAARRSTASASTIDDYSTVWQAFAATVALSASVVVTFVVARTGNLRSYGAVSLLVLAMFGIVYFAASQGLAGPTVSQIDAATADVGNPIAKAGLVFGEFLEFYGWAPFLSGAIAGCCVGNVAFQVWSSDD